MPNVAGAYASEHKAAAALALSYTMGLHELRLAPPEEDRAIAQAPQAAIDFAHDERERQ